MFDTLRSAAESLASEFDAGVLDASGAAAAVRELGLVRRLVDGMLAKAANRVHDTGGHLASGERDAAHFMSRAVGTSLGEAQAAISTAAKLDGLPATDAAVREGRLSARQAELIAKTATLHPEAETRLLRTAAQGTKALQDACQRVRANGEDPAERAKRQHSSRTFRMWTADDGMVEGRFRLTPEVGGPIKQIFDDETQRVFRARRAGEHESHEAYAADVFVARMMGDATGKGVKHTVHVVIDHEALVRGNCRDGERCEIPGVGPVNVESVRHLLGQAFLTVIIKHGRDINTVAHLGRYVPGEVRTAMIVGGRECDVEGCECRTYLERDHSEVDYAQGGPTAWWNLTWLCSKHHRRKSAGWALGPRNPHTGKRPLRPPGERNSAA